MKLFIQPVGRNLLVKPTEIKKSEGGIILMAETTDAEQRAATTGTVLATPWAEVGDVVIFKAHTGMRVKNREDDEEFMLLIRDVDVAALQKGES